LGEEAERSRFTGKLLFTRGMCDAAKVLNKKQNFSHKKFPFCFENKYIQK
jgi:hypothetical protein